MNQVFLQLLRSPNAKEFLEWYIATYKDCTIDIFQKLPFSHQIGVCLRFLEEHYGFSIIADNTGYICYFTSNPQCFIPLRDRFQKRNFYHIYMEEGQLQTNEYYYTKAIIHLFNDLDIPF